MSKKTGINYKKSTTVTLKAEGFLDVEDGTLEFEGNVVNVTSLLNEFATGDYLDVTIKMKDDEQLELSGMDSDEDIDMDVEV